MRHANDDYPTPTWAIEIIKPHVRHCGRVLDPACGDGIIPRTLGYEHWIGFDINPKYAAPNVACCDALGQDWRGYSIVMNPPYKLAFEFVQKATKECHYTVALLRLSFLESVKRRAFHRANLSNVYVLSRRPSFTADGKTDGCAYAWFIWGYYETGYVWVL
jgi:hypothetical protein